MMKRIIFVLILLVLPASVSADELKFIKGKGVPVCEAYLKNIKHLSLQDMVCGGKPETKDIKIPKWEKLDLRENKELVKRLENFFQLGDQFAQSKVRSDEKEFERLIERWIGSEKYPASRVLYVTKVDINNDGKVEKIVLYSQALCMESRWYARPLAVLDKDKNQIDVERTMPLLQNVSLANADLKTKAIESIYRVYDVFFYKNDTYFDKWSVDDWTLSVYHLSKDNTREICKFNYFKKEVSKNKGGNHAN